MQGLIDETLRSISVTVQNFLPFFFCEESLREVILPLWNSTHVVRRNSRFLKDKVETMRISGYSTVWYIVSQLISEL